ETERKISGSAWARPRSKNPVWVTVGLAAVLDIVYSVRNLLGGLAQLGDPACMTAALERCFKENLQAVLGCIDADQPGAQCNDIGIVMLTRETRAQAVMHQSGATARDAVGGNRNADSAAADGHAELRVAPGDGLAQCTAKIGIIDAFGAQGAKVHDRVALALQLVAKQVFQFETRMVGSESNRRLGHRRAPRGRTAGPYNIQWPVPTPAPSIMRQPEATGMERERGKPRKRARHCCRARLLRQTGT